MLELDRQPLVLQGSQSRPGDRLARGDRGNRERGVVASCQAEPSRAAVLAIAMYEIRGRNPTLLTLTAISRAAGGPEVGAIYAGAVCGGLRVAGVDPIAINERTAARRAR